ncbi:hypothetical protein M3Y96_00062400 [Aphelenchoides besseyi]|nr:hypothetical protein M3Y96_00062400 [Aphelenchoides besseyi]
MFSQSLTVLILALISTVVHACIGLGGSGCCQQPPCAPQVPQCTRSYVAPASYGGSYAAPPAYVSANLGSSYAQPSVNAPYPAPAPSAEYLTKGKK